MTGLSYAGRQVQRYDHDRFLTAIFAPAAAREHLFALYAFNLEIAKTREMVSEPLLGRMRLQWWRDALDKLYAGQTIAHEVARPLSEAIAAGRLDRALFDRLIDAREADMDDTPFADLDALEAYAEGTAAPLVELAIQTVAAGEGGAWEAARPAGIAWALTGLLRAVPFHARHRRLYLPQDRLAVAGVRTGRLFDLKPDAGLPKVTQEIAERALLRVREARAALRSVPRRRRSPLLVTELAALHLKDLRRAGWDPFAAELRRGRPMAAVGLALQVAIRRY